jgi:hypothetical protein
MVLFPAVANHCPDHYQGRYFQEMALFKASTVTTKLCVLCRNFYNNSISGTLPSNWSALTSLLYLYAEALAVFMILTSCKLCTPLETTRQKPKGGMTVSCCNGTGWEHEFCCSGCKLGRSGLLLQLITQPKP